MLLSASPTFSDSCFAISLVFGESDTVFMCAHACVRAGGWVDGCACACALKRAFDNLVAITMRDVSSCRVPTPGFDRHTGRPAIIHLAPVPPTTLCPLPGSQHCACAQGR
jgi:hypothetical protein